MASPMDRINEGVRKARMDFESCDDSQLRLFNAMDISMSLAGVDGILSALDVFGTERQLQQNILVLLKSQLMLQRTMVRQNEMLSRQNNEIINLLHQIAGLSDNLQAYAATLYHQMLARDDLEMIA